MQKFIMLEGKEAEAYVAQDDNGIFDPEDMFKADEERLQKNFHIFKEFQETQNSLLETKTKFQRELKERINEKEIEILMERGEDVELSEEDVYEDFELTPYEFELLKDNLLPKNPYESLYKKKTKSKNNTVKKRLVDNERVKEYLTKKYPTLIENEEFLKEIEIALRYITLRHFKMLAHKIIGDNKFQTKGFMSFGDFHKNFEYRNLIEAEIQMFRKCGIVEHICIGDYDEVFDKAIEYYKKKENFTENYKSKREKEMKAEKNEKIEDAEIIEEVEEVEEIDENENENKNENENESKKTFKDDIEDDMEYIEETFTNEAEILSASIAKDTARFLAKYIDLEIKKKLVQEEMKALKAEYKDKIDIPNALKGFKEELNQKKYTPDQKAVINDSKKILRVSPILSDKLEMLASL